MSSMEKYDATASIKDFFLFIISEYIQIRA